MFRGEVMGESNKRKAIFTIPNFLSLFRILLIPLIFVSYKVYGNLYFLGSVIVLSGLTDVLDGIIARKFNMISDLGKMLDPFADKLTQGALICCLIDKYPFMLTFICVFVVFEVLKAVLGYIVSKRTGVMRSAKWFGKVTTVYLYVAFFIFLLFTEIDLVLFYVIAGIGMALIVITSCLYCGNYVIELRKIKKEKALNEK